MSMFGRKNGIIPRPAALVVGLPDLFVSLRRILGPRGYWVSSSHRAVDALRHAEAYHPDLVLADLRLPDLTGMELARTLNRTCPSAVVILVGTEKDEALTLPAMKSGAAGLLLRPIEAGDLDPWTSQQPLGRQR
jgi:DNA-binding response OmpR family regulator